MFLRSRASWLVAMKGQLARHDEGPAGYAMKAMCASWDGRNRGRARQGAPNPIARSCSQPTHTSVLTVKGQLPAGYGMIRLYVSVRVRGSSLRAEPRHMLMHHGRCGWEERKEGGQCNRISWFMCAHTFTDNHAHTEDLTVNRRSRARRLRVTIVSLAVMWYDHSRYRCHRAVVNNKEIQLSRSTAHTLGHKDRQS